MTDSKALPYILYKILQKKLIILLIFPGRRSNARVRIQVLPTQRCAAADHGVYNERGWRLSRYVRSLTSDIEAEAD